MSSSKQESMRIQVVKEIISTEETYNNRLSIVSKTFTQVLKKEILDKNILKTKQIQWYPIFENLDKVLKTSSDLQRSLKEKNVQESAEGVGKCFIDFSKLIGAYFDYITVYYQSIGQYQAEVKNPVLIPFITACTATLKDTIEAVLITPIQRPPRYRLLLEQLIKYSPKNSPDIGDLQTAHQEICTAISSVDNQLELFSEGIRKAELKDLISDFDAYVSDLVRLYHDCQVDKFSRKRCDSRYLILTSNGLLVAEPSITGFKITKSFPNGTFLIVGYKDISPFKNAIDVREKTKSFRANLSSPDAKIKLLNSFNSYLQATNLNPEEIESKGFAPVWVPDSQAPKCMVCQETFTMFFRRHHCRYCGDVICNKCFIYKIPLPYSSDPEPQSVCRPCYVRIVQITHEANKGRTGTVSQSRPVTQVFDLTSDYQDPPANAATFPPNDVKHSTNMDVSGIPPPKAESNENLLN